MKITKKLTTAGNSICLIIPAQTLRDIGLKAGSKVNVEVIGKSILITKGAAADEDKN